MRFNIGSHKWTRLLVLAVVVYLALLPVWWYLLQPLATASGFVAGLIYHLFDSRVSIVPDGRVVRVLVGFSGGDNRQNLRLDTVTYGLPMLAALVIATHSNSILSKIRALAAGLGVMFVFTVLAIMAWAKLATLGVDEQLPQSGDRSSFLFYFFHGYAFSQPVVAVLLWFAIVTLGMFKESKKQQRDVVVPRNAPCPCGSGRKYKKCCAQ
ncbi:MAG TPA: SEC-C domain-containing protein [Blastocatellia bacterium]|nr:SEC-C domain-containing protein [Blastocatellia bacterium]